MASLGMPLMAHRVDLPEGDGIGTIVVLLAELVHAVEVEYGTSSRRYGTYLNDVMTRAIRVTEALHKGSK